MNDLMSNMVLRDASASKNVVAHYLSTIIEYDNSVDEDGDDANKKKMLFITHFMIPTE